MKKVLSLVMSAVFVIASALLFTFTPSSSEESNTNTSPLSQNSLTVDGTSGYWTDEYIQVSNDILEEWYQSESPTYTDTYTLTTTESLTVTTYYAYTYTDGNTYVRVPSANPFTTGYTFNDDTSVTITSGSTYWFKVEPIKWIVLNPTSYETDGYYYLVADNALAANIPWATSDSYTLWSSSYCSVRKWLNDYFIYDAFDDTEYSSLNTGVTIKNNSTSSATDGSGTSTTDSAWLLSYDEVVTTYEGILFASGSSASTYDQLRRCMPSDFALANYCHHYVNSSYLTLEGYYSCSWWLRSAYSSSNIRNVSTYGSVSYHYPTALNNGVRPALQINDTSIEMIYSSTTGRYYIEYGSYPQTYVSEPDTSYPGSGSGTQSDPYIVTSAEELAWFAYYTESVGSISSSTYIELGADIDLSGKYWTPIGNSTYSFAGNFDGKGYTISGLTMVTNASYVGLFGCANGATIANFTLEDAYVFYYTTATSAPELSITASARKVDTETAIAENAERASLLSSTDTPLSTISPIASIPTDTAVGDVEIRSVFIYIGLICGYGSGSTISNIIVLSDCYLIVEAGSGAHVGGLLGYSGTLYNCLNYGYVYEYTEGSFTSGESIASGGMIGYGTAYNCINYGYLHGIGTHCGGVAGSGYAYNCIAECDLFFDGSQCWSGGHPSAGGIVGGNNASSGCLISNCYYKGTITIENSGFDTIGPCYSFTYEFTPTTDFWADFTIIFSSEEYSINYLSYKACAWCRIKVQYSDTGDEEEILYVNSSQDFSDWFYDAGINNGLPVQKSLFSVGAFYSQDSIYDYMVALGYSS